MQAEGCLSDIPLHQTVTPYGVSEDCLMNDHTVCRSPRCGCDCHVKARQVADERGVNRVAATSGPIPHDLEKVCPVCQAKYAEDRHFCTVDGHRLSSLKCPECGSVAAVDDNYCGYCGQPMKGGERQQPSDEQLEAAATGPAPAAIPPPVLPRPGQKQPIITMGMFK